MPRGAVLSEPSAGENVQHFAALRVRVIGVGQLKMLVRSLGTLAFPNVGIIPDDIARVKVLVPFLMKLQPRFSPTRIVNFVEQRASFELKTTEFDEYFRIHRITVYMKEIFTSHPGS